MGMLDWLPSRRKRATAPKVPRARSRARAHRAYAAGVEDRLMATMRGFDGTANEELRRSLRKMRARSRQLAADNDYAIRFLAMVRANVIGPAGVRLQAKAVRPDGTPDQQDNRAIEATWAQWGEVGSCTVCGRLSWLDVQRLAAETIARDGEILVRLVEPWPNRFGFALQVLEGDHLDEAHNEALSDGGRIVMGVEEDKWGRPRAYHVLTQHPGASLYTDRVRRERERIPASDVVHAFLPQRPGQSRGAPWMHSSIRRLSMLGGYEEAEVVAARTSSSKMGFYTSPDGDLFPGDDSDGGRDLDGELTTSAEAGTFEQLPAGVDFKPWDPQHPTSAFDAFVKAILRGAASGLNVSYHTLANDLEGVNFSSIRSGVLEEREQWRTLQRWLVDHLHMPVYRRWLRAALMRGAVVNEAGVALPLSRIEKFSAVRWSPRGWSWVDPLRDQQANAEVVASGFSTASEVVAAAGRDLEEVYEQLATERQLAAQYGIAPAYLNGQRPAEENAP